MTQDNRLLAEVMLAVLLEARRKRRRPTPWPNLTDMDAARRMSAVRRRRGRRIAKQLLSFRWADDPVSALRDLKMRARGGR
jgi:hypothetical protein